MNINDYIILDNWIKEQFNWIDNTTITGFNTTITINNINNKNVNIYSEWIIPFYLDDKNNLWTKVDWTKVQNVINNFYKKINNNLYRWKIIYKIVNSYAYASWFDNPKLLSWNADIIFTTLIASWTIDYCNWKASIKLLKNKNCSVSNINFIQSKNAVPINLINNSIKLIYNTNININFDNKDYINFDAQDSDNYSLFKINITCSDWNNQILEIWWNNFETYQSCIVPNNLNLNSWKQTCNNNWKSIYVQPKSNITENILSSIWLY